MTESTRKILINFEQCHSAYQQLIISGGISTTKKDKDRFEEISEILERFSVKILPFPSDTNRQNVWKCEKKKIGKAYGKMLSSIRTKKIVGVFYDSDTIKEFARPFDSTIQDPSVEVCWTLYHIIFCYLLFAIY